MYIHYFMIDNIFSQVLLHCSLICSNRIDQHSWGMQQRPSLNPEDYLQNNCKKKLQIYNNYKIRCSACWCRSLPWALLASACGAVRKCITGWRQPMRSWSISTSGWRTSITGCVESEFIFDKIFQNFFKIKNLLTFFFFLKSSETYTYSKNIF